MDRSHNAYRFVMASIHHEPAHIVSAPKSRAGMFQKNGKI